MLCTYKYLVNQVTRKVTNTHIVSVAPPQVGEYGPKEMFGELALSHSKGRQASVLAMGSVETLELSPFDASRYFTAMMQSTIKSNLNQGKKQQYPTRVELAQVRREATAYVYSCMVSGARHGVIMTCVLPRW
jgi:CRP-like cAMP-binding protein